MPGITTRSSASSAAPAGLIPRRLSLGLRAALVAGALELVSPAQALADYKESYKKGLEAAGKKNWAEVARLMQQAAAEQSNEGEPIKLYGMRFETYLPHYYLGLARFNTGDCAGALREWETSQKQGAVKGAELKTLIQSQKSCQTRAAEGEPKKAPSVDPAQVVQAARAAEAELGKAEETGRSVDALQREPELAGIWSQESAFGGKEKQAQDLLTLARGKLEGGRKSSDLAALAEAKDAASRAAEQLETVRREAGARRDELRQKAAEAARSKELKLAAAPTRSPAVSPVVSPPVSLPVAPVAGPPQDLIAGTQAYFNGRYREAADLLGRTSLPSGPAAAHAALVRAAARYALFVVGGERDATLRQAAVEDVRSCMRTDPALVPDPQAFSPRFVDFFKKSR